MFQERIRDKGRLAEKLKHEVDLISTATLSEDFSWVKDSFVQLLQGETEWENEIESALDQCGVNVRLSDQGRSTEIDFRAAKKNNKKQQQQQQTNKKNKC